MKYSKIYKLRLLKSYSIQMSNFEYELVDIFIPDSTYTSEIHKTKIMITESIMSLSKNEVIQG